MSTSDDEFPETPAPPDRALVDSALPDSAMASGSAQRGKLGSSRGTICSSGT